MTNIIDWDDYRGFDLYDGTGEKIGGFGTVYLDDETGRPTFLGIRTGLFGMNESFVPADSVQVRDDRLVTHYTKDDVKSSPNVAPTDHLSRAEEEKLYSHFGRSYAPWSLGPDRIRHDRDVVVAETVRLRRYVWIGDVPVQGEAVRVENDRQRWSDSQPEAT